MRGLPIVISAPSGAGKGTVIPFVMKELKNAAYSVSCTTREPRPGEVHGVNYYYITRQMFLDRIAAGEMLEHNEYVGNLYGTPRKETEEKLGAGMDVIFEIDVNGAMNIKSTLPEAVLIMILPPDYDTLESRLKLRGTDDDTVIAQRMAQSLKEIEYLPRYDYFVINETGKAKEAADRILAIIEAERHTTQRHPDYVNQFKNNRSSAEE